MVSLAEWACALSCWKSIMSSLLRKNGTTSGSKISSMYQHAIKLPSTTSWVLWCHEIPPHTIMLPPPQRDTCLTQQSWNRSPCRRHTLRRLSNISTQKRNSSMNSTPRQYCCVHRVCCQHQLKRLIRSSAVKTFPLYVLWLEIPHSWRRCRTVKALTHRLWVPTVSLTVSRDVLNRSRKWLKTMYWSCWHVVTLSRPGRCLSSTDPVELCLSTNRAIVVCKQPIHSATWRYESPLSTIQRAWWRSTLLRCPIGLFLWNVLLAFNVKNQDLIVTVKKMPKISWLRKFAFLHFARAHAHHENHAVFVSNKLMLRWQLFNTVFISWKSQSFLP